MIFVHGNKTIVYVCTLIFVSIISLCICKLSEINMELKKNIKEYNLISSNLEESNKKVIEGIGL